MMTRDWMTGRAAAVLALAAGLSMSPMCLAMNGTGAELNPLEGVQLFPLLEHSTQGYMGVNIRDVSNEQLGALKLKEARGAEVVLLDHDGPACTAGMREHDVILQMNGQTVEGEEALKRMLKETPAGRTVTFVISRDGQQQTISMTLANREEVERQAWEKHTVVPEPFTVQPRVARGGASSGSNNSVLSGNGNNSAGLTGNGFFNSPSGSTRNRSFLGSLTTMNSSYTGAVLTPLGSQLAEYFGAQGLLVNSVEANSPAASAGMRAGDVVIRVNATPVASEKVWAKAIHENRGRNVAVVVLRDKKETTLTLVPDGKKRSSVEPLGGLGALLGDEAQAEWLSAKLDEMEPRLQAMAEDARRQFQQSPELGQLRNRMQALTSSPELQRELERARVQSQAAAVTAAEAARQQIGSPEFRQQMEELKRQVQDLEFKTRDALN